MNELRPACPLCAETGGLLVARGERWRVVRVEDAPSFPAFYRLIWNGHVAEFSDLDAAQRLECMEAVTAIERALREALAPSKINLATLGNVVPHLHWHVIARFDWDSHFPNPIWGETRRQVEGGAAARLALPVEALDERVRAALAAAQSPGA
ncbi:HIT family protein [Roseateles violae]|uniref:HIT family protein n=1 Tax=Roseateles violae TaxID=3058042 RepID=A0ABT8DRR5_9BURK|nr:HIT family protein [Pelomonas sp. PFR6]MDN3920872.1 HIT family protein [Pelomonas sp. PFR6]